MLIGHRESGRLWLGAGTVPGREVGLRSDRLRLSAALVTECRVGTVMSLASVVLYIATRRKMALARIYEV